MVVVALLFPWYHLVQKKLLAQRTKIHLLPCIIADVVVSQGWRELVAFGRNKMIHTLHDTGVRRKEAFRCIFCHSTTLDADNVPPFSCLQQLQDHFPEGYIPKAPPIPLPESVDPQTLVNALGEPTLSSLGLGSWYTPVGWIQNSLEWLHVTFDLPWWGSIAIRESFHLYFISKLIQIEYFFTPV